MSRPIIEIDGLGKKYRIRGQREFGFRSKTPFEEGLAKSIEWYVEHKAEVMK